jgi:dihydrofolate reductase
MPAFLRSIDTVLWGRKTYELALGFGERGTSFGKPVRNCVFSRGLLRSVAPGFELVHRPLGEFVRELRSLTGRDVWVMGGAQLIGSLLDEGEIDDLVVHVVPTLIGEGVPLLSPRRRQVPLKLKAVRRFADGVVRIHYTVERTPAARPAARTVRRPPARDRRRRPPRSR